MAMHQYIGARYVPYYYENSLDPTSCEWENNVNYEPLTIVTLPNLHSYISKKFVPDTIGTPASNPEYWLDRGYDNAYIQALQDQIDDMNDGSVSGSLQNQINTLDNRISDAEDDISLLMNRKVIVIGDSYCGNLDGITNGVYTKFLAYSGMVNNTNAKLYYKGGAGFCGNTQGKTFGDLINDAITEAYFDPDTVTDVIIAGGANDRTYTASAISTAKDTARINIISNFPNANIMIAMIGGFSEAPNREQLYNSVKYAYEYMPALKTMIVENAYLPLLIGSNLSVDGIHPNASGCDQIGNLLAQAFKTRSSTPSWNTRKNYNTNINPVESGHLTGKLDYLNNGFVYSFAKASDFTFTNAVSGAWNTGFVQKIGSTTIGTDTFFVANAETTTTEPVFSIPFGIWALTTGSKWLYIQGELIGIATTASNIDWYFKSATAPENFSSTQFRIAPLSSFID